MRVAKRVDAVVVGGGLSGLVSAWRLRRAGIDAVCLEASERVGGALCTHRREGFVAEGGANTVQETPALTDLVRDLELEDQVQRTAPGLARFIYRQGVLHRLPQSILAMLATSIVSRTGKLRILGEMAVRSRARDEEESVASFVERRFGREALDALVAPFVSGTFAGDPAKLGAAAVLPRLVELERRSGSVLRGLLGGAAGDAERRTGGSLLSFRGGLQSLADALAARLGDHLWRGTPVTRIDATSEGYRIEVDGASEPVTAPAVVLAVPAWVAAVLLSPIAPQASAALAEIEAPRLACVSLAWPLSRLGVSLDGLGFLVAPGDGVRILGCLWPSSMFEGRAPGGVALLTSFVGGARDPEGALLDDEALVAVVAADLARILGAQGEPRVISIDRYERAIPQYTIGHRARVERIRAGLAPTPGVFLAGNYFDGIAVGDCVRQGLSAASTIEAGRNTAVDFSRHGV